MARGFGRNMSAGKNFLGMHKAPKMGMGKHNGMKPKQAQPPSTSAFDRKELSDAASMKQ